ncbi:MAG TPA: UDP-glucose 4-epimerase GalE [Bacillota bacterium]|nr:UDP-glucose 4-epimerase GalE [Bacillota bacterium]HPF42993.1 UDP-glucose 4-epimerase GalE [Bacillota bacterium]HPJ85540.1 UDP-glucose 4-epimerase GalE [Bacillota bacterium]HRX91733.1 UDP-glucose 4-epimerase GalE [Candidatus Izemoplasmatales bacterium]
MKIVVTGGAGYIGSHFVKAALNANHEVHVVDNLTTGHREAVDSRAIFHLGDIRDLDFMETVFAGNQFDSCVHFAACSLVPESMEKPFKYFDNNVNGMLCLLETMKRHQTKTIVFSSSAAVYGDKLEMPITEDDIPMPTNPYGESKLIMEKMMKWADAAYGIRYVSLRYFNVAGASCDQSIGEDHRPETHLIPIVLQVPLGLRENIVIYGNDYDTEDGTCVRDYIHVGDLVSAHLKGLDYLASGKPSDIFNLGNRKGFSNLEIVETASRVTGYEIEHVFGPRRAGDPARLIASNLKAEKILGWIPKKGLEEIIRSAWEFHQKHPYGYEGDDR